MNKKLLTAAIGAALAAGPMLAQADVKLYGKIHVSVDYLDAKGPTQPHNMKSTTVANNTSRWGIDVSEKLGGGLTAIGKLESQIDATGDNTLDSAVSQNRYVGLSGKFGTLLAGIHDTPYKDLMAATNLFTDQVGDARNIIRQNGGAGQVTTSALGLTVLRQNTYDWDARPANSIRYQTPNMSGFTVTYLWSADASGGSAASASTTVEDNRRKLSSLSLGYASGPLYVAYAHETHRFTDTADATGGVGQGDAVETGQRLAASYNFGAFKAVGLYQTLKNLGGKRSTDNEVNRSTWGLGGAYTAGNNVFKAHYYKANKFNQTFSGGDASNTGASMWAVGWDHLFSKTAKGYVAYAKTTNQTFSALLANAGGHGDQVTPDVGNDPSVWSVGMILDF